MLAGPGRRSVFVRDIVLEAAIGVYPHEHRGTQRIRVNVDLAVADPGWADGAVGEDRLERVVSYEDVVKRVRAIAGAGHTKLVETMAERIAAACLEDGRVLVARVRVEKLDVFPDAGAAGVEVERCRLSTSTD